MSTVKVTETNFQDEVLAPTYPSSSTSGRSGAVPAR